MPLQNRVTPDNQIIRTTDRGTLMGNRGCLHDDQKNLVRHHNPGMKRWIICVTEFRNRQRTPMTYGRYTELFFLDEATALAAGHRPCGECQRVRHRLFKKRWIGGNPQYGLTMSSSIDECDAVLHADRLLRGNQQRVFEAPLSSLPGGVFVRVAGSADPCLWWQSQLLAWSTRGYEPCPQIARRTVVHVLTPASIVQAIRSGFQPNIHESAAGLISDQVIQ